MSLYTIMLITVSRCLNIIYKIKLNIKNVFAILSFLWAWTLFFVVLPLSGISIFNNWDYINSEACLIFNFSYGQYNGWAYGFVFFILFSILSFLIMTAAYVRIIIFIRKARAVLESKGRSFGKENNKNVAIKRMLLLIATNLILWFPVVLTSLLAVSSVDISNQVSR